MGSLCLYEAQRDDSRTTGAQFDGYSPVFIVMVFLASKTVIEDSVNAISEKNKDLKKKKFKSRLIFLKIDMYHCGYTLL